MHQIIGGKGHIVSAKDISTFLGAERAICAHVYLQASFSLRTCFIVSINVLYSRTNKAMDGQTLNLLEEADFIINDIKFSVNNISLSKILKQSPSTVYFNITSKEDNTFTVRLSGEGFLVVSHELDTDNGSSKSYPVAFETVYSLLEHISASYVSSFGNALLSKLNDLQQLDKHAMEDS